MGVVHEIRLKGGGGWGTDEKWDIKNCTLSKSSSKEALLELRMSVIKKHLYELDTIDDVEFIEKI